MTVASLKIGKREFVVIPKREYARFEAWKAGSPRRRERVGEEDRRDIELARRRLRDPRQTPVPYAKARRELGLA
jgi:hypothetical protein